MVAFNSDDLEFSDRPDASPSQSSRPGARSTEQIFEHAAADRVSTKKLVKQLTFTDGGVAPTTRMRQSLWSNHFDGMRIAWGQDLTKSFTGENIIRFFVATVRTYVIHPQSGALLADWK